MTRKWFTDEALAPMATHGAARRFGDDIARMVEGAEKSGLPPVVITFMMGTMVASMAERMTREQFSEAMAECWDEWQSFART